MGKILAFDYGTARTGIAVTDDLQMIAFGLMTVETPNIFDFLKDYLHKEQVNLFVIGLPLQTNNTLSESEQHISKFIKKLDNKFPDIPIERFDERFTSKIAYQSIADAGLKKSKKHDKKLVDQVSATLILQSYLESR